MSDTKIKLSSAEIDGGGAATLGGGGDTTATQHKKNGILKKLFSSCAPDPRGSVHRAWGISLLFVVLYFALSIFESKLKAFVFCRLRLLILNTNVPGSLLPLRCPDAAARIQIIIKRNTIPKKERIKSRSGDDDASPATGAEKELLRQPLPLFLKHRT